MILCAGLSPAWQHILLLDELELGEVNRLESLRTASAGKVLNACWAIASLEGAALPAVRGEPVLSGASRDGVVRALTVLGGSHRAAIEREMHEHGVRLRVVACAAPTRVATTLVEARVGRSTELVENQGALSDEELAGFLDAFAEEAAGAEIVVLTGSLPRGAPSTTYQNLLARARGRVLLDARGPELLAALEGRPFLVKPNREELARTLGRELPDEKDVLAGARQLVESGAEWALVSQGRGDLLLVSRAEEWRIETPTVRVVNPIGCGDTLTGALAWALDRGEDVLAAVRLGVAAAALNAEQLLIGRVERARAESLSDRIVAHRL